MSRVRIVEKESWKVKPFMAKLLCNYICASYYHVMDPMVGISFCVVGETYFFAG